MSLDYNSLLLAVGFSAACLSLTLFGIWLTSRSEKFLLTWAFSVLLVVGDVFTYDAYIETPTRVLGIGSFILLLLGMVAYGIYFGASHSVQQIAADAARTAIAGETTAERRTLVEAFVAANAGTYPFVDPNKLTADARDSVADPNQFDVSVRYDARNLPIWNLFPRLIMPTTTISRRSTIRIGGI